MAHKAHTQERETLWAHGCGRSATRAPGNSRKVQYTRISLSKKCALVRHFIGWWLVFQGVKWRTSRKPLCATVPYCAACSHPFTARRGRNGRPGGSCAPLRGTRRTRKPPCAPRNMLERIGLGKSGAQAHKTGGETHT